jgi:hypothetical protein
MTEDEKQAIREWGARWKAVNEAEAEELRRMTVDEKFRQLASLMALARSFGSAADPDEAEVEAVRAAWKKLKAHLVEPA